MAKSRLSLNPQLETIIKIAQNETVTFSFFHPLINSPVMKELKCARRYEMTPVQNLGSLCLNRPRAPRSRHSPHVTHHFPWASGLRKKFFGKTNPN
jgi:hypothetical protein